MMRHRGHLVLVAVILVTALTATGCTLFVKSMQVEGVVKWESGNPVTGAKVTLAGPTKAQTTSDAEGRFAFAKVRYGAYQLEVTVEGELMYKGSVQVKDGTTPLVITVDDPIVPVTLLDKNGRPVEGANITMGGMDYVTDADGTIAVPGNAGSLVASVSLPLTFDRFTTEFELNVGVKPIELQWAKLVQVNAPEDWAVNFSFSQYNWTPEGYMVVQGADYYTFGLIEEYADFIMDVDVELTGSSLLFFRASDPFVGYGYWRRHDQWADEETFRRYWGSEPSQRLDLLTSRTPTYQFEEDVNIRITADGNQLSIEVNGQPWGSAQDGEYTSGRILFRKNYSANTPLTIKRLTILEL